MRMVAIVALAVAAAPVPGVSAQQPPSADPLTVIVQDQDVHRFAKLWKKTGGHPSAAQIDAEYIKPGSAGVVIFTPHRIINGANMAEKIAAHRDWYDLAVGKCLPWIGANNAELRS